MSEIRDLAEKLIREVEGALRIIADANVKEINLNSHEARVRGIENKVLADRDANRKVLEQIKQEKDFVTKANAEILQKEKILKEREEAITQRQEKLKAQEEEMAVTTVALEKKIQELRDLTSREEDLKYREALVEKEKKIAVERKETLDFREKKLDQEKQRLSKYI